MIEARHQPVGNVKTVFEHLYADANPQGAVAALLVDDLVAITPVGDLDAIRLKATWEALKSTSPWLEMPFVEFVNQTVKIADGRHRIQALKSHNRISVPVFTTINMAQGLIANHGATIAQLKAEYTFPSPLKSYFQEKGIPFFCKP